MSGFEYMGARSWLKYNFCAEYKRKLRLYMQYAILIFARCILIDRIHEQADGYACTESNCGF